MPISVSNSVVPFQAAGNVEVARGNRTVGRTEAEPTATQRAEVVKRPDGDQTPLPDDVVVSLAPRDPTSVLLFNPGSRFAGGDGTVLLPSVDLTPQDVVHIVSRRVYRTNLDALRQASEKQPTAVDRFV
jgi:flagellar basal body rod protein FlgC